MKLRFKRAVAAGRTIYHEGTEHEIKDQAAAETYIAHGYAEDVGAAPAAPAPAATIKPAPIANSK